MSEHQLNNETNALTSDTDRRTVLKRLGLGGLAAGAVTLGGAKAADAQLIGGGLVTVVIGHIDVIDDVTIQVRNNNIAVQVCAVVEAIDTTFFGGNTLTCEIRQR